MLSCSRLENEAASAQPSTTILACFAINARSLDYSASSTTPAMDGAQRSGHAEAAFQSDSHLFLISSEISLPARPDGD